ncbi:hypothetical protein FKG94_15095 [Exilibacterium tricleocarpae]|uniref:Uncharacterized protein n=1 Tax=Exilibacterium tricleocarpae TaxID=2591008 RepID=A0A545TFI2_9GAMM|nr:hypothetical protein [Exilibacterium tricleocarpae]TQV75941.1 hypothetical protein FKG94_15095 [Exilibacterium tricleocarpae]
MGEWIPAQREFNALSVNIGDIVHLKMNDDFNYLVKAVVVGSSQHKFMAKAIGIFDWTTKYNLSLSQEMRIQEINSEPLELDNCFIHSVIKT